jgi:hypothetical protein
VTASFIKELLRRAAMVAATDHHNSKTSEQLVVNDSQMLSALDELLNPNNELTRVLLGGVMDSTASTKPPRNEQR